MGAARDESRLGSVLGSGLILFRLAAAPFLFWAVSAGARGWAMGLFSLAVLSDALDGYVGRRWGGCPCLGPFSDAGADFVLVAAAFVAFTIVEIYPAWILALIGAMFVQFVVTSRGRRPVYDPIGKYYGLFLFAAVGLTLLWPCSVVRSGVQVGIAAFTIASVASRASYLLGRRDIGATDQAGSKGQGGE